ncbi:PepSY domain-containing protein [uncultured Intestinimonas sp.]|uniref:PepSY domain-containing protein n=1 Tax=uncultured Intestinimonas sp. TaxID=1689265 RepID=UPI0025D781E5|nr:PepSY domain-containing protein [uncultured Intestinimonas sp.]
MNDKIETSLRRAAEQLPQPDFQAMADIPVQPLEVHDYVTRQEFLPPRRRFPLAAAALVICALVICAGLWAYFQFFQVYSVVDLRVNPAFAIELDRRDQVKSVNALSEDARPILEGRSYQGWDLETTVEALLDDLWAGGYLGDGAQVDVAVNSKSADHGRDLREEVDEIIAEKLQELSGSTALPPTDTGNAPVSTPPVSEAPASHAPTVSTAPSSGGMLTRDEVQAIVIDRLPGASFEEVKLDEDDGNMIYEVKFRDTAGAEYEADLDAFTGEILKWEKD